MDDYRIPIFHYLWHGYDEQLPIPKTREQLVAIIDVLKKYAVALNDESMIVRLRQYAEMHLSAFIKENLNKRRWSSRMNALYMIESFRMLNMNNELESHYQKKDLTQLEETQILKIYAYLDEPSLLRKLLNSKHTLSDFEIRSILTKMKHVTFSKLVNRFDMLPFQYQLAVLDTIATNQLTDHYQLLKKTLEHNEIEVQIRTLKAYVETGLSMTESEVKPFLFADAWQMRMLAAKVVGVQQIARCKETLVELLSDREYVVRKEAAVALLSFSDGIDVLADVIQTSNDRFAIDMAKEQLERERGKLLIGLLS